MVFVGGHLVQAAQARGHELTLFNRVQHNPQLFPQLEGLRGDRGGEDHRCSRLGRVDSPAGQRWADRHPERGWPRESIDNGKHAERVPGRSQLLGRDSVAAGRLSAGRRRGTIVGFAIVVAW